MTKWSDKRYINNDAFLHFILDSRFVAPNLRGAVANEMK